MGTLAAGEGNRMTKRTKWVVAGLAVGVVAGLGAAVFQGIARTNARAAEQKKETPPLEFAARDVVQLAPRVLSVELLIPGTIQAVSQATVRSKVSAEVRAVTVRE